MQSAAPHVLRVLDRRHTPGRAAAAAREARAAGFAHVNLDLIYGTPGRPTTTCGASLDAVLAAGRRPRLGVRADRRGRHGAGPAVARGEVPDARRRRAAARYELIDERLTAAGLRWYEVSNWAAATAARCRHNLGYWRGGDWWGLGPGAHSHVGGVRWWNVKHPARYAALLAAGESPEAGREELTERRAGDRAGDAGACAWRRGCRWTCSTTRAAPRRPGRPRTACSTRPRSPRAGPC